MIKINLLPYRAQRKKDLLVQQIFIAVIPLLLSLAVVIFFWVSIRSDITSAENEIASLNQKIKQSKVKMKEIEAFKKKKETLTKKMDVIKTLQKGKSGPVHIVDELSVNLPGNLWLTDVVQKGMTMEIKGKALDNISISNYMINLGKSPYFTAVDLKQIRTTRGRVSGGILLKEFAIICKVTYKPKTAADKEKTSKSL